jgi:glycosyltransferase involved in cell wall biosynthesis
MLIIQNLNFSNSEEYLGLQKPINMSTPLVSVMVITYMHEKNIAECLDSILGQKTNFDFEIVIGEDSSTDNTRIICKEYAEKYLDKIRLHLRDRKQTSVFDKNGNFYKSLNGIFTLKSCRGKYIAICEGDDYWTDENKLQEQYDLLESNQNVNLCFHAYQEYNDTTKQFTSISISPNTTLKHYSINEVILGDGSMMATCSLFFRREVVDNLPDWLNLAPVGDYFIQILSSLKGGALFLNKSYAVYRIGQSKSWSNSIKSADTILSWFKSISATLELLNEYTYKKFYREIDVIKSKYSMIVLANSNIGLTYRKLLFNDYKKNLSIGFKLKWILLYSNLSVHKTYLRLRGQK